MAYSTGSSNVDWKRGTSVNSQDKLTTQIATNVVQMELPDIMVLQEVNKTTGALAARKAGPMYAQITEKVGYDHLTIMYNRYKLQPFGALYVSNQSKYVVGAFQNCESGEIIVVGGVHLPFKNRRGLLATGYVGRGTVLDAAHQNLAQTVNLLCANVGATKLIVAGDFNTQPDALAQYHPNCDLVMTRGDTTTKAGTCPDNVLYDGWDGDFHGHQKHVYRDCPHFTHYPIWANMF